LTICDFDVLIYLYVNFNADLEGSLQAHQYFADANEAESWMKEKEPLAGSVDYGKDEDSTEALLKKQEALMSDLEAFESTIVALREQALSCPVSYLLNLFPIFKESPRLKYFSFVSESIFLKSFHSPSFDCLIISLISISSWKWFL